MSVLLDDYQRDVITTRNGKHVAIDIRYVPWPTGRGYETQVFRCNSNGTVTNYIKSLDEKRLRRKQNCRRCRTHEDD